MQKLADIKVFMAYTCKVVIKSKNARKFCQ